MFLTIEWSGVDEDAYDCEVLKYTTQFNEPDPMIFKALIGNGLGTYFATGAKIRAVNPGSRSVARHRSSGSFCCPLLQVNIAPRFAVGTVVSNSPFVCMKR